MFRLNAVPIYVESDMTKEEEGTLGEGRGQRTTLFPAIYIRDGSMESEVGGF